MPAIRSRSGDPDLISVAALGQAAGAPGPDQVVRARRGHRAAVQRDIAGRRAAAGVHRHDRVVQRGRAAIDVQAAPPPLAVFSARVELMTVSVALLSLEMPPPLGPELPQSSSR